MLVRTWMNRDIVTVDVGDSMQKAGELMKAHDRRLLPVTNRDHLVGVVSDSDLKKASASSANTLEAHELLHLISKIKIGEIMTQAPITIPHDFTVEEAAFVLLKHRISGAPVLGHEGELMGTISQMDIYRVLLSVTAFKERGIQLAFKIEVRPHAIQELIDIIRKYDGRIANVLSSYDTAPTGYKMVYIRVYDLDRTHLSNLMNDLRQHAEVLYYVDHRERKREIYSDEV